MGKTTGSASSGTASASSGTASCSGTTSCSSGTSQAGFVLLSSQFGGKDFGHFLKLPTIKPDFQLESRATSSHVLQSFGMRLDLHFSIFSWGCL